MGSAQEFADWTNLHPSQSTLLDQNKQFYAILWEWNDEIRRSQKNLVLSALNRAELAMGNSIKFGTSLKKRLFDWY
jgi:hypothetical protein